MGEFAQFVYDFKEVLVCLPFLIVLVVYPGLYILYIRKMKESKHEIVRK